MHFIVAWELHNASAEEKRELSGVIRETLTGESFVQPFSNLCIVRVSSAEELNLIESRLDTNVVDRYSASHPDELRFLVSPAFPDGRYSGWLSPPTWDEINRRTLPAALDLSPGREDEARDE